MNLEAISSISASLMYLREGYSRQRCTRYWDEVEQHCDMRGERRSARDVLPLSPFGLEFVYIAAHVYCHTTSTPVAVLASLLP